MVYVCVCERNSESLTCSEVILDLLLMPKGVPVCFIAVFVFSRMVHTCLHVRCKAMLCVVGFAPSVISGCVWFRHSNKLLSSIVTILPP